MATNRTLASILALAADNTAGDISPSDIRDIIVSTFANYGSIYVNGGVTTQVTNVTGGVYDLVTGFTTDGPQQGAVTAAAATDKLTLDVDGTYLLVWVISFTGTVNATLSGRIYVGGVTSTIRWSQKLDGAAHTLTAMGVVTATAADDVECYVTATTTAKNFIPADMTLLAIKIG